ncbi:MAG: valine--tRNA ligase [Candidatus Nanoarchaeia archaeon]|nr:valine--tRNA ligase [Candidatus Nanoarchaeia archaeon]MDD5357970.1 valine--tRNA ligase [Candidatus Nanoarchaeia archaeon]MDD5588889.1 valine--tRNA ligase [Candidatus Nanoarchaeia archaeon]
MAIADVKNWNIELEKKITDKWKVSELFKFDIKTKKKIYSIDTPPPYVNAPIHIGQAITYCYMDFFARYRRMKGFEVIFPLGLDRNGLPIEMAAEKAFGVSPFRDGRDKFIEACKKLLEQTSSETQDTFAKLGISFTSYKEGNHVGAVYKTDSPDYRKITQATFIELFRKGLIYEDNRINNWDPKLQTTIADSEIEYKDIPSTFNFVKWKVKETGEEIIIATTRPELICTCGMVIFNPTDKRYKHLEGKTAISPIFNKEIPIKSNKTADVEKGTGIVMMCSAGDLSDIQFFREQNLEPKIAINIDGTMNEHAGILEGLKVKDARNKIIELLKEKKLLSRQEQITHRTPISERSGAEIEFIQMPEFYLKQIEFKDDIRKIADKINFFPKEARKILDDWLDSIKIDWPISRRRFYATPIPLWISGELIAVGKSGEYYEPWKESPKKDFEVFKNGKKTGVVGDFKDLKWEGETRVLDTWMDSSISELIMLKYKTDDEFFKKSYPATLRPQGKEIIRTWLYYTLLRGYLETKKPCFKDVWINQHITDKQGYKMSKSKGNVVDPQKLLKLYGAEAIRLWASIEGDLSKQDLKCSEEKISAEVKTLNKIINVAKFVNLFEKPSRIKLTNLDKLFVDYIEDLTKRTDESYGNYDFYHPALELRRFLWEIFASHYIEIVKSRAYNQENKFSKEESNSARYTLHYLFERFLVLMYPIIPQITSVIADDKGINLLKEKFPAIVKTKYEFNLIEKIIEFNSNVWKDKKEKGISLRNEIEGIKIPKELKAFENDLISAHNLK